MKHHFALATVITIAVLVSGCGAPAAPTANPADIQSTAMAAAFTKIAETQAAIPTDTPLPPTLASTQTPLPTDTPLSLPTLAASPTVATTSNNTSGNAGTDPCDSFTKTLVNPSGQPTRIRIDNTTRVAVTVSIYLNKTEFGECGYRGYNLSRNGSVVIDDLVQGCYNIWAWSDDPKGRFRSAGYGCINNSDKWSFEISEATVKFVGP